MASKRRIGAEGSKQRSVLMDAAEAILCDEGYAGISARNVAERAGLTKQLLYYYYRTMDDLILDLVRRINERRLEGFKEALQSADSLKTLWSLNMTTSGGVLAMELSAIAGHREAIRLEIISSAQKFRALQTEAVSRMVGRGKDNQAPVAGMVMIAAALGRIIPSEAALGLTEGHADAIAIVEKVLDQLSKHIDASL